MTGRWRDGAGQVPRVQGPGRHLVYILLQYDTGPLIRNAYMVNAVAYLAALGCRVLVLGLVDATSATRGTDHTLRLARAAGLTVERLVWEGRAR